MQMPIILPKEDTNTNTSQFGAFAVYCFHYGMNSRKKGNQHGTIASKISAIRWRHRFLVGYEPAVDSGYRLLMRGIKRMSDPVTKKHPLTVKMLRRLHEAIDWSQPKQQLMWGAVTLAYFFLLRRSEFLRVDGKWENFVLRFGDANFYDTDENVCAAEAAAMVGIVLRGSKNNQYGRTEIRYQFRTGDPVLCPVLGLAWIHRAAKHFGTKIWEPLTSMGGSHGLGNGHVVQMLKALAQDMGNNPADFSSHSIRIGGTTTLLNGGAPSLVIKLLGRWLSDCYQTDPTCQRKCGDFKTHALA